MTRCVHSEHEVLVVVVTPRQAEVVASKGSKSFDYLPRGGNVGAGGPPVVAHFARRHLGIRKPSGIALVPPHDLLSHQGIGFGPRHDQLSYQHATECMPAAHGAPA